MKFEIVNNGSTNNSTWADKFKYEDHPFESDTDTDNIIEIVHGVKCKTCGKDILAHMKPVGGGNE